MRHKKRIPIIGEAGKKICPICGMQSYSTGGIHPQCAVRQADAARAEKIIAARKRKANARKQSTFRNKKCPRCGSEPHVRRKVCDCGHAFV